MECHKCEYSDLSGMCFWPDNNGPAPCEANKEKKEMDNCSARVIEDCGMDYRAMGIVCNYIEEHLDKSDEKPHYQTFVVWKAKVLQNWKFLVSSNMPDGMYYEVTYNGDRHEWYLDAYKKFENKCVQDGQIKP